MTSLLPCDLHSPHLVPPAPLISCRPHGYGQCPAHQAGQELLWDRPSLPGLLGDLPGRVRGRSVLGESSKAHGDTPCAMRNSADLSISTGLFLTIFGPFHLFLNLFLLFAQVLCANWELAPLGVGGLSGLPYDRFTLSLCLCILAVWFYCNVLDLDFASQC